MSVMELDGMGGNSDGPELQWNPFMRMNKVRYSTVQVRTIRDPAKMWRMEVRCFLTCAFTALTRRGGREGGREGAVGGEGGDIHN